AGYKVGMTHVLMVDDHKDSPTEGKEIMVPVTIIEIPTMKVAAIRAYTQDTYGRHAFTEIWAEPMDSQLSRRVTVPRTTTVQRQRRNVQTPLPQTWWQRSTRLRTHSRQP